MISKEILTDLYSKQGKKQVEIAKILNVKRTLVNYYCQKYNLKPFKYKRNGKHWTKEEIELLESLYGTYSYNVLSKKLDRSPKSIECKKQKLSLGKIIEATEYINSNELGRALKRNPCTIRKWIKENGLPCSKRVLKLERKFYRIDVKEFWRWAKKNNDLMDWDRYEIGNLPNEPKWILEEKKKPLSH